MNDRDRTYLLKELTRTIDESDSTAAFCLCQRWILKNALALLKEQEAVVRCKDCKFWNDDGIITTCEKHIGNGYPGDWFCADGERKIAE